jgi:hypothetical protein
MKNQSDNSCLNKNHSVPKKTLNNPVETFERHWHEQDKTNYKNRAIFALLLIFIACFLALNIKQAKSDGVDDPVFYQDHDNPFNHNKELPWPINPYHPPYHNHIIKPDHDNPFNHNKVLPWPINPYHPPYHNHIIKPDYYKHHLVERPHQKTECIPEPEPILLIGSALIVIAFKKIAKDKKALNHETKKTGCDY